MVKDYKKEKKKTNRHIREKSGERKETLKSRKELQSPKETVASSEIEKTIRHIRENAAERKETLKVRKNLQSLTQRVAHPQVEKKEKSAPGTISEGDRVRIAGQHGSGIVLAIKGKNASVQFGELKST